MTELTRAEALAAIEARVVRDALGNRQPPEPTWAHGSLAHWAEEAGLEPADQWASDAAGRVIEAWEKRYGR